MHLSILPSISLSDFVSVLGIDTDWLLVLTRLKELLQFFFVPVQGWRDTGFHAALQLPLGTPRLSRQITLRC